MRSTSTKKLVFLAIMVSQALILSIVENFIPIPRVVPGVKLGLANIVTLIIIIFFGLRDAMLVTLVRVVLGSIFGGGFIIMLFSLAGGILSTLVMHLMYKRMSKAFSLLGVSITGSLAHNLGQMLMASLTMREAAVLSYLPVLLISGIIMGSFVGLCTQWLKVAFVRLRLFDEFKG